MNIFCATCKQKLKDEDAWKHTRDNHEVSFEHNAEELQELVTYYNRLALKAKDTGQEGAKALFSDRAKHYSDQLVECTTKAASSKP